MLKRNLRDPEYGDEIEHQGEEALADLYQRSVAEGGAATQPRPDARAARAESVIDAQSTFDGRFVAEADLRIEGTVSGELICRGLLTVEREAQAKAKIEARDARILGHVDGEISCSGKLELAPTAVVKGTLRAAVLVVQEGASLVGNVETKAPGQRADLRPIGARADEEPQAEAVSATAAVPAAPEPVRERNARPRAVPSFALAPSDTATNGRDRN